MSEKILKDDLIEQGVLDNILKPLAELNSILDASDAKLKAFGTSAKEALGTGDGAKAIRDQATALDEVNKAYERKTIVVKEQKTAADEEAKIKQKILDLEKDEIKSLAALKAELSAKTREMRTAANAAQSQTATYSSLAKETQKAKNESKELGAQMKMLERDGKANSQAYQELATRYAEVTAKGAEMDKELKAIDKAVGDNFRNVGNYRDALHGLNERMEQGGLSMREMSKAIKEYQSIAIQAGPTSAIGQEAMMNAAKYKDIVSDASAVTTALSSDTINLDAAMSVGKGLAGGFQAATGAAALFGGASEEVQRSLQKMMAIQSVFNGIKQVEQMLNKNNLALLRQTTIAQKAAAAGQALYASATGGATVATKAFRIALISTGIGAIVIGLIALIANFDRLFGFVKSTSKSIEELGEKFVIVKLLLIPITALIKGVTLALEKLGIIDSEETKKANKLAQEKQRALSEETEARRKLVTNAINENKRLAESVGKYYDFEIRKAKASGKDVTKLEREKRAEMIKTYEAQMVLLEASFFANATSVTEQMRLIKEMANLRSVITGIQEDDHIADLEQSEAGAEASAKAAQERAQKVIEAQNKEYESRMAMYKKIRTMEEAERTAFLDKYNTQNDVVMANFNTVNDLNEIEILSIKAKYAALKEEAIKYGKDVNIIKRAEQIELDNAEQKHEADALKRKESALNALNLEQKKANATDAATKEEFQDLEKEREIKHLEDLIALRKSYGEDVTELEISLIEKRFQEASKKEEKLLSKSAESIAKAVSSLYDRTADAAIEALKRQQTANEAMMNHFSQLAASGNIQANQSMSELIERQEENERRQQKIEQQKLRRQRATQASTILLKELEAGKSVPEALAAMGAFLAASGALIPSFFDGTENTGAGGNLDKNGGFLSVLHEGERVVKKSHNSKIGDISNPMLADIAYQYRTGQLIERTKQFADFSRLESGINKLIKVVQDKPEHHVGFDEAITKILHLTVSERKGGHTNKTEYKS